MDTDAPVARWSRQGWLSLSAVFGVCILLTAVTGLVFGWFAVYFQFFGETPDADDYAVGAGAYGAAAVVLLLGALTTWNHPAPRWLTWFALISGGVLAVLAVSTAAEIPSAEPGSGYNHWWDGAGGVIACPWTWPLVVFGVLGTLRRRPVEPLD